MTNKIELKKFKEQKSLKELLEFCIINIDKPSGPTSFNVSDYVRRAFNDSGLKVRKTSHFGTLDPKVTGVLPIAINRACKLTGYFLGKDKEYVGIMRLHEEKEIEEIEEIIKNKFTGVITQTPPVRSRVKRQAREREIAYFDIIEKDENGKDFLFKASVQGGTYIRKLIDDLGTALGVGAHMLELRRVRAGIFSEGGNEKKEYPGITLYDLDKALEEYKKGDEKPLKSLIIPGEIMQELYPVYEANEKNMKVIYTGKPLIKGDIKNNGKEEIGENEDFVLFNKKGFVGIYSPLKQAQGNIIAKPKFVLQPIV